MSIIKLVVAAAAILMSLPAVAEDAKPMAKHLAASEAFPNMTHIYLVSGLQDDGGAASVGSATTISCTNFAYSTQQIRFVVRNNLGIVVASRTFSVLQIRTFTVSTHNTKVMVEDGILSPGVVLSQGSLVIYATDPQITCSASIIDAAAPVVPYGLDLHLVRFNPYPGSQE